MKFPNPVTTVLSLLFLAPLALVAQASGPSADLPVRKVHLFSSGVAYVEHGGTVVGDATASLKLETAKINDLLKSLVMVDLDGGTASMVRYPSQDPLARSLAAFTIDLGSTVGLAGILRQARGQEVILSTPTAVRGRVLGVETQKRPAFGSGGGSTLVDETVVTLLNAQGLQGVVLTPSTGLAFTDPRLQAELEQALALVVEAADPERKSVDLGFRGTGQRRVRVAYVAEAPVWKTSYRLDLSGAKPWLQAWAMVENTSGTDWTDVSLSLVSGQPVSFIQDLYTPLYNPRPVVGPSVQRNQAPVVYQEGRSRAAPAPAPMISQSAAAPSMAYDEMSDYESAMEKEAISLSANATVQAQASGAVTGELFSFTMARPVSIPRRQSALLPLYTGAVSARKVVIYTAGQTGTHPLNGVLLTNDSGVQLPAGPLTVLDGGTYAGDALMDTLVTGDTRLISYATDLSVSVDASVADTRRISAVRIVEGVLTIERLVQYTQTYAGRNKADQSRTLLVQHPRNSSRRLLSPAAPADETSAHLRFEVAIPPRGAADLVVKEEQTLSETMVLANLRPASLLAYSTQGDIPATVRTALARAVSLQNIVTDLGTRIADLGRQKTELENNQARLRSNITTLGRDSTEGRRYVQRLVEEEERISTLTKDTITAQEELRKAQADLAAYLKGLSVR